MRLRHLPLSVLLLSMVLSCAKGGPLTSEDLSQAQARWGAKGPTSYQLVLEITGDNVETGRFEIEVTQGKIVKASRNRNNLATTDSFYTVPGLFHFLDNELELGKEPKRYFGAAPTARIYMRAHFDPSLGYPTRYLRTITETRHNITVEVQSFTPR